MGAQAASPPLLQIINSQMEQALLHELKNALRGQLEARAEGKGASVAAAWGDDGREQARNEDAIIRDKMSRMSRSTVLYCTVMTRFQYREDPTGCRASHAVAD